MTAFDPSAPAPGPPLKPAVSARASAASSVARSSRASALASRRSALLSAQPESLLRRALHRLRKPTMSRVKMFVFVDASDAVSRSRAAADAAEATVRAYGAARPTVLDKWYADGAPKEVHAVGEAADLYAVSDFADGFEYLSVFRRRGGGERGGQGRQSTVSFIGARGKGKVVIRALRERERQ